MPKLSASRRRRARPTRKTLSNRSTPRTSTRTSSRSSRPMSLNQPNPRTLERRTKPSVAAPSRRKLTASRSSGSGSVARAQQNKLNACVCWNKRPNSSARKKKTNKSNLYRTRARTHSHRRREQFRAEFHLTIKSTFIYSNCKAIIFIADTATNVMYLVRIKQIKSNFIISFTEFMKPCICNSH